MVLDGNLDPVAWTNSGDDDRPSTFEAPLLSEAGPPELVSFRNLAR